jgi:hypothetical protein
MTLVWLVKNEEMLGIQETTVRQFKKMW